MGPTVDFFVGWKVKTKSDISSAKSYYLNPSVVVGALIKVSKEINLEDRFFLEPELRLNRVYGTFRTYGGGAVALKYRLGKRYYRKNFYKNQDPKSTTRLLNFLLFHKNHPSLLSVPDHLP